MIVKFPRDESGKYYNVKITDKHNNSFIMLVGGNLDLYWVPEDHKKNLVFEFDESDKRTYNLFNQLFNAIKQNDDHYRPVLKDNKITYISEEWTEEESNTLNIIKEKNSFIIKFNKNQNQNAWTFPHRGCALCFCNSGSRVPKVESIFMSLFNYLAYESSLVKEESSQNQKSN